MYLLVLFGLQIIWIFMFRPRHFPVFLIGNIKKRWSRKPRIIILLHFGLVTFEFHFRRTRKNVYVYLLKYVFLGVSWSVLNCLKPTCFYFQVRESLYPSTCRLPPLHPTTLLGDTSELEGYQTALRLENATTPTSIFISLSRLRKVKNMNSSDRYPF